MYKYVIVGFFAVVAYVAFFADDYPGNIEFRGHTLGSKEDNNNTIDNKLDIFSYRDTSNQHIIIFAIRNNSEFTLNDITEQYLKLFRHQGFKFKQNESRYLGVKADEAIYMTESIYTGGIVMYIEKGGLPMPREPDDGTDIFNDMENFSF